MKNIYLFTGLNQYQIEKDIEELLEKANVDELSYSKYDAEETPIEQIVEDCMTLSFFATKKVVIINNPVFLSTEKSKLEHQIDAFTTYIKNPNPDTLLIINAYDINLDKRKNLVKELQQVAEVINYDTLTEDEARVIIRKNFSAKQKKIDFLAENELINRIMGDSLRLYNELDKIFDYMEHQDMITFEEVAALVAEPIEHNIFNLTNQILAGQTDAAIKTFHKLIRQNEEPLVFSAILAKNFHNMLLIKQYQKQMYTEFQVREKLKLHPYQIKKLYQESRLTAETRIQDSLLMLHEYDLQVKTGKVDKHLGFELYILRLANT